MTKFGPHYDKDIKALVQEAVADCLKDAGAQRSDIQAAFYANCAQDTIEGQTSVGGQVALHTAKIDRIPVVNVENACASGSTAVWLAKNHILAGQADIVLAVGVEKLAYQDKEKMMLVMKSFEGGTDIHEIEAIHQRLTSLGEGIDGDSGTGHRTFFMEIYANFAKAHMKHFGTTQKQMAVVASKNHYHASLNPKCHYNKAMSVEEILEGRPLSYPLTVPMCSPLSDGAAAALLCNRKGLSKLGITNAVKIHACVLGSAAIRAFDDWEDHITRRLSRQAYEVAGLGPDDVDVAEVHDAASFGEILQSEMLGFCPIGEGGTFAESGATRIGGKIPINVSGGLESKGHPIGATGLGQIYELVMQLRGRAGERQVEGARFAIQENGGGLVGIEEASAVVTILGKQ
jgi:acetyl-CoA acetyltransferase